MGRKGEGGHLKRKPAPKLWPIHRKEAVWTVMPKPGSHPLSKSLPLALIVRDILGYAETAKEAKNVVSRGKILVNGKVRRDIRFLVGLMDIVSIPDAKKYYRVLPSKKGLVLHPISAEEAEYRLCRIEDKTLVKGGNLQLNLHDGTTISIPVGSSTGVIAEYHTLDVLKINVADRELLGYAKLSTGAPAIVTGGKNMGKVGKVIAVEDTVGKKRRDLLVTLEAASGEQFQTILDFVFVLGETEPLISLPEAN